MIIARLVAPVLCGLLFCAASLRGQDSLQLSLPDAIRTAVRQSSAVSRSENSIRTAEGRLALAEAGFGPDLRLVGTPSARYAPGVGTGDSEGPGGTGAATAGLSVSAVTSWQLFDGSARSAAREAARFDVEASRLTAERTRQEVALSVTTAFVDAMVTRELIGLERENLVAETRQGERVDAFVAAGTRPVSERFTQQAAVAAAELRVLTAERNHQVALLRLCLAIGIEPTTAITLVQPGIPQRDQPPSAAERMVRGDLHAQGLRVTAAERGVEQAAAGNDLGIGLTGSVGTGYSSATSGGFGDQVGRDNPAATLGVSVTLPLFDRGRVAAETAVAEVQRDERTRELTALRHGALAQEREAALDYTTAIKRVAVAERQLDAARQALDAEEARYQSGSSTLAELALARARYLAAATQRLQADYQLLESDTALSVARGTFVISD